jgi:DNA topoisomerase-1
VKHGGINATVPRDLKPEELTLDQAVSLLAERAAKGPGKKPARAKKAPKAKANGVMVAAPANDTTIDTEKKLKTAKKKPAPKRKAAKAKTEPPPRTGTDG